MQRVWDESSMGGDPLLVLVAIARFADDEGYAWPSVAKLVLQTGLSQRQVIYCTKTAQKIGELEIHLGQANYGGNLYEITLLSRKRPSTRGCAPRVVLHAVHGCRKRKSIDARGAPNELDRRELVRSSNDRKISVIWKPAGAKADETQ